MCLREKSKKRLKTGVYECKRCGVVSDKKKKLCKARKSDRS